jgi:hypothetical protein
MGKKQYPENIDRILVERYDCRGNAMGYVKHAFVFSFFFLLKFDHFEKNKLPLADFYKTSIKETIR